MANVTATTADLFFDEIWSPELNRAVEFKLVIMALFADWTKRMSGSGDVFHLPNRHNLTANTKSAGSDATPEALTETQQNFTVSTHQIVAQEIEDFAEVMSKYDIRNEYTLAAAYALGRAQDVAAAALLDDNTTQTVGTLNVELTDDNFIRAWQYLQDSAATLAVTLDSMTGGTPWSERSSKSTARHSEAFGGFHRRNATMPTLRSCPTISPHSASWPAVALATRF